MVASWGRVCVYKGEALWEAQRLLCAGVTRGILQTGRQVELYLSLRANWILGNHDNNNLTHTKNTTAIKYKDEQTAGSHFTAIIIIYRNEPCSRPGITISWLTFKL